MARQGKKLTSVRIQEDLWDAYRIESLKRKFPFQRLAERSIDLFMSDEEFREKLINHRRLNFNEDQ